MTRIKICDVRTPEIAAACASFHVDMIGLHCIWHRPTPDRLATFRAIRDAVECKCKLVLVTRQSEVSTVADMVSCFPWDYVQLNADWTPESILRLKACLLGRETRPGIIGVVEVSTLGLSRLEGIVRVADLVLLDSSIRGGSGTMASTADMESAVSIARSKPFLIAGGLRARNVSWWIGKYRPWGVDVQSGVEQPGGGRQKDLALLREFVAAVRVPAGDTEEPAH
jgi:phosphoribosylanthranilate isomerase